MTQETEFDVTKDVPADEEMPSGFSSDFLTTEDKEMLVESAQTFRIVDAVEGTSKFGPTVSYTLHDEDGELIGIMTQSLTDSRTKKENAARRVQFDWFRKKLIDGAEGTYVPARLVKKGRAYDFDKPLPNGQPF